MTATLEKFGYPHSLVQDFTHWVVLLRPAQVTLGALVLGSKHAATNYSALPIEAFTELKYVTHSIEAALTLFNPYDKINFLALMMVDPHVHFHVLPRYQQDQFFEGQDFKDTGWPGVPDLKFANSMTPEHRKKLQSTLVDAFAKVV
jgi:diadenosine tetraphosphate (Ap4A) HIT family hydrolase